VAHLPAGMCGRGGWVRRMLTMLCLGLWRQVIVTAVGAAQLPAGV
jgi:hypothetical protein